MGRNKKLFNHYDPSQCKRVLLQASVSRMPRGGDGGELEEPCITCIRIELGEAVCPDGEIFSLTGTGRYKERNV